MPIKANLKDNKEKIPNMEELWEMEINRRKTEANFSQITMWIKDSGRLDAIMVQVENVKSGCWG